jgi:hypothetical protein
MSEREDTNDAWWQALESDERWQRHMAQQAELTQVTKELRDASGKRYDPVQVPAKRGF